MPSWVSTNGNLQEQLRNLMLRGPILIALDVRVVLLGICLVANPEPKPLQVWAAFLALAGLNFVLLWRSRRNRLMVQSLRRWQVCDAILTLMGLSIIQGNDGWSAYLVIYAAVSASLYMLISDGLLPFLMGPAFIVVIFLVTNQLGATVSLEVLVQYALILFGQVLGMVIRHNFATLSAAMERSAHEREVNLIQSERLEMSRELHDSLAKTVHGTEMIAAATLQTLRAENSAALPQMEAIRDACRQSSREAREVLTGLRTLSQQDFRETLVLAVEQFRADNAILVETAIPLKLPPINPDAQWAVVKVLQELLENVRRHSHATEVRVEVVKNQDSLFLTIIDNGIGLPTDKLANLALRGHFGLVGMQERVRALGGSVNIMSHSGGGTKITLAIPLDE